MKETNKLLKLLINYTEIFCMIKYLAKMNKNVCVMFLLEMWMKRKMNLFYKYDLKNQNLTFSVIIN